MKKKIEFALQKDHKNAPRFRAGIYYPHSSVDIDELIHKQDQLNELLIQKAELEDKLREMKKEYTHTELKHQEAFEVLQQGLKQTDAAMYTVSQQSEANHESIKSLQEKLEKMISEIKETKHQFTLSKNDLQSYLKTVHDTNTRMDQIEKTLSNVTDYFNKQRKEKKKELSISKKNKEPERKDKEV